MAATTTDPHIFVIMGATGDLMHRKLLPAIYHLRQKGQINENFVILGAARNADTDDTSFRTAVKESLNKVGLKPNEEWIDSHVYYLSVGKGGEAGYPRLQARIQELEAAHGLPGNRIFYLALPPGAFPSTITGLGQVGLNKAPGWTRLVVEKPFGRDLESALELNKLVHTYFDESQVYRIDHYLGKETVQNLLVLRFANLLFESIWNRDRIDRVEITVAESLGIEDRAGYYDKAGCLRDMIQNHLTQLLTLTAMEVPGMFTADAIRNEKVKVLNSIVPIKPEDVVFGQYAGGIVDGKPVNGYLEEPGVAPGSQTETYVALRLSVNNWRWEGVPFYLRTAKRMPRRTSQIAITFRCPPVALFETDQCVDAGANVLLITIQPDEGFDLRFLVKAPSTDFRPEAQHLRFRYSEVHGSLPDGYETLLLDVMTGDATLFVRADEVEAAWKLYTPLLQQRPTTYPYSPGTWGPAEANRLLGGSDQQWITR